LNPVATIIIELEEALYRQVCELAERQRFSVEQVIVSTVAERLSTSIATSRLQQRAARADRRNFEEVLAKIADRPPEPGDELGRGRNAPSSKANLLAREDHVEDPSQDDRR
jgi:hypothetical protein